MVEAERRRSEANRDHFDAIARDEERRGRRKDNLIGVCLSGRGNESGKNSKGKNMFGKYLAFDCETLIVLLNKENIGFFSEFSKFYFPGHKTKSEGKPRGAKQGQGSRDEGRKPPATANETAMCKGGGRGGADVFAMRRAEAPETGTTMNAAMCEGRGGGGGRPSRPPDRSASSRSFVERQRGARGATERCVNRTVDFSC